MCYASNHLADVYKAFDRHKGCNEHHCKELTKKLTKVKTSIRSDPDLVKSMAEATTYWEDQKEEEGTETKPKTSVFVY